jgi:dihydroxy-acid dehydratase
MDTPTVPTDPAGVDRGPTSYGDPGFSRYLRRAFLASSGFDRDDVDRPVVGIVDTSSDYTTCHRQAPELIQAVRRGVLEAGGLPMVFPTMSLGEILLSPTSMLFRNLMAMETEEMIRAQPMDAVVLVGGCDKTLPAQLMAALSADRPAVTVPVGAMMTGSYKGERLGACTDCRRFWADHRSGGLDEQEVVEVRESLCPTAGTCMVMGTASSMASINEALGMGILGSATPPSVTGDRARVAVQSGRRAVDLAVARRRPSTFLTRGSFDNAITVLTALGGSTNAIVHLLAIAGRAEVPLALEDFARIADDVPLLVDCKPSGVGYMEDFHRAGGVPTLLKALEPLLDLDARTVEGRTMGEALAEVEAPQPWQTTIRTLDDPLGPTGTLAVVSGSLAPDGAIIKPAATDGTLLKHRGPALVVDGPDDAAARLDDPDLEVTPDHVLVMRNAGPIAAGMPEAGSMPIPRRLARAGVTDMVRISDARMSGTAYGTVVLHVSPEAAAGGPLALVRDGDEVELDVPGGRLELHVDDDELARRRAEHVPPPRAARGWRRLYADHVLPSHLGADLDFLVGRTPSDPDEGSDGAVTDGTASDA